MNAGQDGNGGRTSGGSLPFALTPRSPKSIPSPGVGEDLVAEDRHSGGRVAHLDPVAVGVEAVTPVVVGDAVAGSGHGPADTIPLPGAGAGATGSD